MTPLSGCVARLKSKGTGSYQKVVQINPAPASAQELITTGLYEQRGRSRLVAIMRICRLTSVLGLVAPIVLGLSGCFIATEGETYDDTYGSSGPDGTGPMCSADQVGSEGCQCTMGDKCNEPFLCNPNLNLCISDTCPVGSEGCPCTGTGACDEDLQCLSDFCVDNECPTGTAGCTCTPGGGCDPGLDCASEVCVDPSEVTTGASRTDNGSADTNDAESTSGSADSSGGADTSSGSGSDPDTSGGVATTGA